MKDKYLIAAEPQAAEKIAALIGCNGFDSVSSAGEARRSLISGSFDYIIINTPLSDENGIEAACDFAQKTSAAVLLLINNRYAAEIMHKVSAFGVFVLEKPLNRQTIAGAMNFCRASHSKALMLSEEKDRLERQLRDLKIVSAAKLSLIKARNIGEPEAHALIEKWAMDRRIERRRVAEMILSGEIK